MKPDNEEFNEMPDTGSTPLPTEDEMPEDRSGEGFEETAGTSHRKDERERDRKKRKIAEQAEEIEKLKDDNGQLKDQYLRLQAEFDNYRRRTAKERLELIDNAGKDVLVGFLPVIDDCQRALQVLRESDASEAAVQGTELIYNKLMNYLKQRGVERIEALGAEFNTDFHEAVAQFPVDDPEKKNKVYDVTQEGYTLNGTVIRYAKVVVGI